MTSQARDVRSSEQNCSKSGAWTMPRKRPETEMPISVVLQHGKSYDCGGNDDTGDAQL